MRTVTVLGRGVCDNIVEDPLRDDAGRKVGRAVGHAAPLWMRRLSEQAAERPWAATPTRRTKPRPDPPRLLAHAGNAIAHAGNAIAHAGKQPRVRGKRHLIPGKRRRLHGKQRRRHGNPRHRSALCPGAPGG